MREGKKIESKKRGLEPCLGFRFTAQEEIWIRRAIRLSKEYMETYGKGREPYMVDLSYYSNSWYDRVKNTD